MPRLKTIAIAVLSLECSEEAAMQSIFFLLFSFRVSPNAQAKLPALPHRNPPYIHACMFSRQNMCDHHVARLEAEKDFLPGPPFVRKPVFVCLTRLAISTFHALDQQRFEVRDGDVFARLANAGRVNPVGLLKALSSAVELGASTCANLNRKSVRFQRLIQLPAC
nr:hypothetical protein [Deinococcus psychrotolerans]